jgi:hypothetical protein
MISPICCKKDTDSLQFFTSIFLMQMKVLELDFSRLSLKDLMQIPQEFLGHLPRSYLSEKNLFGCFAISFAHFAWINWWKVLHAKAAKISR